MQVFNLFCFLKSWQYILQSTCLTADLTRYQKTQRKKTAILKQGRPECFLKLSCSALETQTIETNKRLLSVGGLMDILGETSSLWAEGKPGIRTTIHINRSSNNCVYMVVAYQHQTSDSQSQYCLKMLVAL